MTAVPVEGDEPDTRQDDKHETAGAPDTAPTDAAGSGPARAAAPEEAVEPTGAPAPAPSPDEDSADAGATAAETSPAADTDPSAPDGPLDEGSASTADDTAATAPQEETAPAATDAPSDPADGSDRRPEAEAEEHTTGAEPDTVADDDSAEAGSGEGDDVAAEADATAVTANPEEDTTAAEAAADEGEATAAADAEDDAVTAGPEDTPAPAGDGGGEAAPEDTADPSSEDEGERGTETAAPADEAAPEAAAEEKDGDEEAGAGTDAPGEEAEPAATGGPVKAETDAERTSTFVALKPLEAARERPTWATAADKAEAPAKDSGAPSAGAAKDGATEAEKPEVKKPGPTAVAAAEATAAVPLPELTKEQPLPPLDLLAQLTNTPPPPETPVRTWTRRVKIWTPLLLLAVGAFATVQALRPLPAPELTTDGAAASFTAEGNLTLPWPAAGQGAIRVQGSGDVGTFGPQKPVPTASVAKIMTAYVVLKGHPLKKNEEGPKITVDDKTVRDGTAGHESRIRGLDVGSKFSQQDMLKMLMIPSGNNIARLLARWDTGSATEAAFVAKMNAAAKDLGMTNTTYTDPSGLDAKTVSTAVDQLKLAEAVMKFDVFRKIVSLPNAKVPGLAEPLNNNNDDLLLAGLSIKGIKTGSSSPAGGTLVWAAYKTVGDKTPLIIGSMMDQHAPGPDIDGADSLKLVKANSQKVIEAVREALAPVTVVKKGQVVGYLDDRLGGRTPLVATRDVQVVGVPGQKLALTLGDGGKGVPHEAKAGTPVGTLTIGSGPDTATVPVAVQGELSAPSFGAKLTRLG
ncbi:serine hydrolase [Streptomyces sp. NPDC089919]|uniref:D-alanyl-D-alanine carboxypeptidase n=1 Tax=Streptomyces sp. NPDC089919 TaxID=3155188 RepID=UPI003449FFE2